MTGIWGWMIVLFCLLGTAQTGSLAEKLAQKTIAEFLAGLKSLPVTDANRVLAIDKVIEMVPHGKRKDFQIFAFKDYKYQSPVQSDIKEDNLVFHLAKIEKAFVCSVDLKKELLARFCLLNYNF